MTERYQQVHINGILSNTKIIKTGIPQGTILGPTLFLIFINDLLNYNECKIISYADDTILLCEDFSWERTWNKAQASLQDVKEWLDANRLSLNVSKTKYMAFSPTVAGQSRQLGPMYIKGFNDGVIQTNVVKYLGVFIDHYLKWTFHIDYLAKRIRKLIYRFYQLRNVLAQKLLLIVYSSLAESILSYGISVWGSAYETTLKKLQVCQNFIIRVIFKIKSRVSVRDIYTTNCILNVRGLYIKSILILIHSKNNLYHAHHSHNTRSQAAQMTPIDRVSKSVCQKSISYNGIKLYNSLPSLYRRYSSRIFKKNIKSYIVVNYVIMHSMLV